MADQKQSGRHSVLVGAVLATGLLVGCESHSANQGVAQASANAEVAPAPPAPFAVSVAAAPAAPAVTAAASAGSAGLLPEAARLIESQCTSICQRSSSLHCAHAENCTPNCLAMAVGTPCSAEFSALYRCLAREPAEHWECADDGVAAVREGFCEKEQEAVVGCMEARAH